MMELRLGFSDVGGGLVVHWLAKSGPLCAQMLYVEDFVGKISCVV